MANTNIGLPCKSFVDGVGWVYNHELNQAHRKPETNEEMAYRLFIQPDEIRAKVRQILARKGTVVWQTYPTSREDELNYKYSH